VDESFTQYWIESFSDGDKEGLTATPGKSQCRQQDILTITAT